MCAINLLVMNGCCSGGSHSAFVTGVQYWPKGRWTACARATLYVRYDRETKRLTASILTSSFQSWLKLLFMKPVVLLSRQLSQWAQTAKVTSPVPLKNLAGTFFPYLTSRSMNYKVEAPAMIEFALCANIPLGITVLSNHCLVQSLSCYWPNCE